MNSYMEKSSSNNRRKKLLINPRFQYRFLANMVCLNILVCSIFYIAQGYFFWKAKEIGHSIGLGSDHIFFEFINEQQGFMNMLFIGTAGLVSCLILGFGLIYSNRIAGPLYKLEKYLRAKTKGEFVGDVKFREKDNFQEVAVAINDYIHSQETGSRQGKSA